MKKLLVSAICFLAAFSVYAQNDKNIPRTYTDTFLPREFYHRKFIFPDSLKNQLFGNKNFSFDYVDTFPTKKFLYYGNNGKGFEVWQNVDDHLYILKPDSTFLSNMPVLKTQPVNDNMVKRK